MSEMVERAARAMCKARGINPDAEDGAPSADAVRTGTIIARPVRFKAWKRFEIDARAAIAILREPTVEMVEAGWLALHDPGDYEDHSRSWRAMIDAALAETGAPSVQVDEPA